MTKTSVYPKVQVTKPTKPSNQLKIVFISVYSLLQNAQVLCVDVSQSRILVLKQCRHPDLLSPCLRQCCGCNCSCILLGSCILFFGLYFSSCIVVPFGWSDKGNSAHKHPKEISINRPFRSRSSNFRFRKASTATHRILFLFVF